MAEKQYKTFPGSQEQLATEDQRRPETSRHKGCYIALVVFNFIVLVAVFVFNGLSAAGPSSGIFVSTPGDQSDKYYLDITPAGWTFSIWGFIYTWQALWVLYSLINLFRQIPQCLLLPPAQLLLYIVSSGSNIAWLFLFDRDHIEASLAALLATSLSLIGGLGVSYWSLDKFCHSELARGGSGGYGSGSTKDVWLVRGLVHNGLGIYAAWTSIASLLNVAMVITYTEGSEVSQSTASTIALGILTGELVLFTSTDLLLLDRFSRYTLTPYIVVVVALIGSISKNWEAGATNSVFSAVLLALASVALVAKVVLTVYRHLTRPLFHRGVESTLSG